MTTGDDDVYERVDRRSLEQQTNYNDVKTNKAIFVYEPVDCDSDKKESLLIFTLERQKQKMEDLNKNMSEMAKKNDNDNGSEKEEQHNDNVSNHCGYQIHGLQRQRQSLSNQTDEERKMLIEEWSNFCSFCFSYKSNPPSCSYFERHYYNDVHGSDNDKLHLIRIATAKTKTNKKEHEIKEETNIVSTVRIFQRNVSMMSSMLLENHYSTKDVNYTNEEENESKTDNATKNADNVATAMVEVLAGGIGEVCTHPQYRRQGLSFALLQNAIHIMESTLFDTTNDDDDDKASTKSKDNHTNNESHPTKQEQTTRTNTKHTLGSR